MKEIEFRAKQTGTDAWIYGLPHSVYLGNEIDSIQDVKTKQIEYIKTDTLGQYTGINDINKTKIYKDDICNSTDGVNTVTIVTWIDEWAMFALLLIEEHERYKISGAASELDETMFWTYPAAGKGCEVIGNIFDNPELIK